MPSYENQTIVTVSSNMLLYDHPSEILSYILHPSSTVKRQVGLAVCLAMTVSNLGEELSLIKGFDVYHLRISLASDLLMVSLPHIFADFSNLIVYFMIL